MIFLFLWIRPTFPRVREDQLQKFAWKFLIPVSLVADPAHRRLGPLRMDKALWRSSNAIG